jgi:hypothetical protein
MLPSSPLFTVDSLPLFTFLKRAVPLKKHESSNYKFGILFTKLYF